MNSNRFSQVGLRAGIVGAVALISLVASTVIVSGALDDGAPPAERPWPSFSATYRLTKDISGNTYDPGEVVPPSTVWVQEYRLEWDASWEWTKTLLADNNYPDRVGTTWHYADDLLIETRPNFAEPLVTPGGPIVPAAWFVKWSEVVSFSLLTPRGSSDVYGRSFVFDCTNDTRDACATGSGQHATETAMVDRESEIPLLFETRIADEVILKYEVIDFELR